MDYETIWNGSKAFNRGYLGIRAETPRTPPPLPDWSHLNPDHRLSLTGLVHAQLREQTFTSWQLQQTLHEPQAAIAGALSRLRRSGVLRSQKRAGWNGHTRMQVLHYWLVE